MPAREINPFTALTRIRTQVSQDTMIDDSLVIARQSLCPEKLGSNPGQGSKGINFSGWHGLDMSITVTKRR